VSKNQKGPSKSEFFFLEKSQYGSEKIQNFMLISGSEEIIKKKCTERELDLTKTFFLRIFLETVFRDYLCFGTFF
jgi:hypothetical protein